MSAVDVEFGRAVAAIRSEQGVSQRDLCARLGVLGFSIDSAALSRIETGKRAVRLSEALAIAGALDVPSGAIIPSPTIDAEREPMVPLSALQAFVAKWGERA